MKVTHVCTSFAGGAGLCAKRIIDATAELGVENKALIAEGAPGVLSEVAVPSMAWSHNRGLRIAQMALADLGIGPEVFRIERRIAKERRATRGYCYFSSPITGFKRLAEHPLIQSADIVHLHWVARFVDYESFFPVVKKPIVWTIHDENPILGGFHYSSWKDSAPSSFKRLDDKLMLRKSAAYKKALSMTLVAISNHMNSCFASSPLLSRFKRVIINNGVDGQEFRPIPMGVAREVLGLPSDRLVFLFSAYNINEERKGLRELISALAALNMPSITLICLGEVKELPQAPFEVRCEGLVPSSRLLSLFYSAADFFALPSFQEAFAQTPLEAMSCGCPVVAFPCSGTDSLINESNGVRCQDFTVESLCCGIRSAMARTFDREVIRRDVLARFSSGVIARQYKDLYSSILGATKCDNRQ